MTQGFMSTGRFRPVAAVEQDKAAAATYALNHGQDHVFAGGIEDWLARGSVPAADVIIGGPPCQGFSALGKQDVQDARNFLWRQYAETIIRAKPKFFVLENVAQFRKSPQFGEFRQWTQPGGKLANYELQDYLLNAADFGSFQNRKRTVVIGRRRDLPPVPDPEPTHVGTQIKTVKSAFVQVSSQVTKVDLPAGSYTAFGQRFPGPYTSAQLHVTRSYREISLKRFRDIPEGGNRFDIRTELLADCWKKHKSGSGDVMGRLRWDKPSVTVRTEFFKPEKGRYLHPIEDRAITHFEAARLQGFPDDYKWVGSKTAIARQIGNAVPIELARYLGNLVAEQISALAVAQPGSQSDRHLNLLNVESLT